MTVRLTRQQLYRWLWTTPAERIAEVIGIAGSTLAKTCRRYDVPTPARGYWRKLQTGQSVPATPLPNPEDIRLTSLEVSEEIAATLSGKADSPGTEQRATDGPVAVATRLVATRSTSDEEMETARNQVLAESPVSADISNSVAARPGVQQSSIYLQPDAAGLRQIAAEHQVHVGASDALDRLQARLQDLEPGTAAALSIWLLLARRELARLDPLEQVVASCHRVASGDEKPQWWTAARLLN